MASAAQQQEGSGLVVALGVRIESGPGGPDTDAWVIDVEVGPGVGVRDPQLLAVALVQTLIENVGLVADALATIHHPEPSARHAAGVPEVRTAGPGRPTVLPLRMARSDRVEAT